MKTNQAGFSLLELLIVLAAVQLIWFISLYSANNQTDKQEFELWYQQFELDLLYLQKLSMSTSNNYSLQFYPEHNKYEIREGTLASPIKRRELPSGWKLQTYTLNPVTFTHAGQLRKPGSLKLETNESTYFIYFPFGKGRCYYNKNK